jgi:rubrerythrin
MQKIASFVRTAYDENNDRFFIGDSELDAGKVAGFMQQLADDRKIYSEDYTGEIALAAELYDEYQLLAKSAPTAPLEEISHIVKLKYDVEKNGEQRYLRGFKVIFVNKPENESAASKRLVEIVENTKWFCNAYSMTFGLTVQFPEPDMYDEEEMTNIIDDIFGGKIQYAHHGQS